MLCFRFIVLVAQNLGVIVWEQIIHEKLWKQRQPLNQEFCSRILLGSSDVIANFFKSSSTSLRARMQARYGIRVPANLSITNRLTGNAIWTCVSPKEIAFELCDSGKQKLRRPWWYPFMILT